MHDGRRGGRRMSTRCYAYMYVLTRVHMCVRVLTMRQCIPVCMCARARCACVRCVCAWRVCTRGQMMEALRPSLDEASHGKDLNTKEAALDYIGRRALGQTTSRANRIKHAQEIVIRELLPHIGITGTMCVHVYVCVCVRARVCRSESHACACACVQRRISRKSSTFWATFATVSWPARSAGEPQTTATTTATRYVMERVECVWGGAVTAHNLSLLYP